MKDFCKVRLGKDNRGINIYGVCRSNGNGTCIVQILVGRTPGAMGQFPMVNGLLAKGSGLVDATVDAINAGLIEVD